MSWFTEDIKTSSKQWHSGFYYKHLFIYIVPICFVSSYWKKLYMSCYSNSCHHICYLSNDKMTFMFSLFFFPNCLLSLHFFEMTPFVFGFYSLKIFQQCSSFYNLYFFLDNLEVKLPTASAFRSVMFFIQLNWVIISKINKNGFVQLNSAQTEG